MQNFTAFYRENAAVHATLAEIDPATYDKYVAWMSAPKRRARVLDVGCGTGAVVHRLTAAGYDAVGVDANRLSLHAAREGGDGTFVDVDSYRLPFPDETFDVVGSYTVLEHLGDPELSLDEQVRVLRPGGRLVIACPNFAKCAGIADHHPRTRGFGRKVANAAFLLERSLRWRLRKQYRFATMPPIERDVFEPDDDAVVVTNPVDVAGALRTRGLRIIHHSGTDRFQGAAIDRLACVPLLRSLVGAVFMVAEKP